MNYEECVEYLYKIPRFTKKAPLSQTEDFLQRLGVDLCMRTPKILHVAGTNGKGSVCAYLDAILRADGYHTGLFTSPHLVEPAERIRIDGKMVSKETFVRCFAEVYPVAKAMERDGAGHPAFFSFLLGMAMVAFSGEKRNGTESSKRDERKVTGKNFLENESSDKNNEKNQNLDYIILETGMGGRLDNTNVFRHPALTVITRIGLDHTQYLGDTREAIAAEKAGILKPGVPAVYLEDSVSAPVIEKKAAELSCPCRKVDTGDLKILEKGPEGILFRMKDHAGEEYRIPFAANYQVENAALAISAAKEMGCSEQAIRAGLQRARWPGRMQKIGDGFYVDGAHNVDGVRALLSGLDDFTEKYGGRRILLFGAVQDKDYEEMFRELVDGYRPDLVILTGLKTPRGVPVEELEQAAGRIRGEARANFSGKESRENSSGKNPRENSSGKESMENSSEKESMENSSERESMRISSEKESMENSSERESMRISSEKKSMENSSERESMKNSSEQKSVESGTEKEDSAAGEWTEIQVETVREALEFVRREKTAEDFLLCAGSLYLVGEVFEISQFTVEQEAGIVTASQTS